MRGGGGHGAQEVSVVQQQAVLAECIRREMKHHRLCTSFSINPFRPMYTVTGKPNSLHDAIRDEAQEDPVMREIIRQANQPPTKKYTEPQTTSQEYGWITQPLYDLDRNDMRLHHPRSMTDVTRAKEIQRRLMEATSKE